MKSARGASELDRQEALSLQVKPNAFISKSVIPAPTRPAKDVRSASASAWRCCDNAKAAPSSTSHSTCVRALSPQRANISGGAFRRVAVLAIEAASALGPNTSVVFGAGASKPDEIGLGLCRWRVCPLTVTFFSVRHIPGADTEVLKTRSRASWHRRQPCWACPQSCEETGQVIPHRWNQETTIKE